MRTLALAAIFAFVPALVSAQGSSRATSAVIPAGGHAVPSSEESERAADLIARGYSVEQLQSVARKAPPGRSLVVALETLATLQANGVSTGRAVAKVESLLAARATDVELRRMAADAAPAREAAGAAGAVAKRP